MKGKPFVRFLTILIVLLFSMSSAQAAIYPITVSGGNDVEPGRSQVPTAPMITWEEQRELVNAWPQTGSLTPSSPQDSDCPPSPGAGSNTGSGNSDAGCPPSSGNDSNTGSGNSDADCPPSSGTDSNTGSGSGNGNGNGNGNSGTDGHYTPGSLTSQEQSLANSVNQERVSRGLSPLVVDAELSAIAREKSIDMVQNNYFAHESPTYGRASDMLDDAGYNYTSVGENIAHAGSVERAHDLLMASPGHRANILGSQWTKLGIGIVSDRNGYPMITELFVR